MASQLGHRSSDNRDQRLWKRVLGAVRINLFSYSLPALIGNGR